VSVKRYESKGYAAEDDEQADGGISDVAKTDKLTDEVEIHY
jgi:hypothetical protein